MRLYVKAAPILLLSILLLSAGAFSQKERAVSESFENIERIKIKTVSGHCVVNKGDAKEVTLEVINSYSPRDSFEPKIKESGKTLRLTEKIYGSNSGSSTWILTVPDGVEIDFSTASGDLDISDVEGFFAATTASGDIDLENCSGAFEISTASGDIMVDDCHGEFQLATASGSIDAVGVVIDYESSFSTASGRVDVTLAKSAEHDINVGSASGSAILDYGGNPIKGTFEMEAKVHSGRIVCPIDFDDEETYGKWDQEYVRKTFTRGNDTPVITIGTASGKAVLKKG
jgi:DUF4097 and DUF4098 domain-containing protein YvlB